VKRISLNHYAAKIHDTARSHGFWPTRVEDAKKAVVALSGLLSDSHLDLLETVAAALPEGERNMGEMLMLQVSELAEALEEHRNCNPVHYYKAKFEGREIVVTYDSDIDLWRDSRGKPMPRGVKVKPEGLAVEFADCLIRILDTMHSLGVDIDEIVQEKMAYNDGREHMHGKAY
jgi:NTP pyrophosphatase (non-canonical NTP hydrolase)